MVQDRGVHASSVLPRIFGRPQHSNLVTARNCMSVGLKASLDFWGGGRENSGLSAYDCVSLESRGAGHGEERF